MKSPREIAADIRPTHPHVTELICRLVRENEELKRRLENEDARWEEARHGIDQ